MSIIWLLTLLRLSCNYTETWASGSLKNCMYSIHIGGKPFRLILRNPVLERKNPVLEKKIKVLQIRQCFTLSAVSNSWKCALNSSDFLRQVVGI